MTDEETQPHKIECTLGSLQLKVQGDDPDWVRRTFTEQWIERLKDAEEMAKAVRDGSRGCA